MKKIFTLLFSAILVLTLAACGGDKDDASGKNGDDGEKNKTLVVGATNEPHAVILEKAKPIFYGFAFLYILFTNFKRLYFLKSLLKIGSSF